MRKIASFLILLTFCRCAVEPSAETMSIRDQRHVLGMLLVKGEDRQLLEMVICKIDSGKTVVSVAELSDRSICRNAFVDADGNSYYFPQLTDKDLKRRATVAGYLKLAAISVIPFVVGIVAGRHAKKIIPKLKFFLDKEVRDKLLADGQLAKQIGFWGGVIGAIVAQHRGQYIFWGKEDRKLLSNWDEIFKIHQQGFDQPKELDDQQAIKDILVAIAHRLSIKVNPEVKF